VPCQESRIGYLSLLLKFLIIMQRDSAHCLYAWTHPLPSWYEMLMQLYRVVVC